MKPILINGEWQIGDYVGSFHATNPTTTQAFTTEYPISGRGDLELALSAGVTASRALAQSSPEQRANFLEGYADLIEAKRQELSAIAHSETGLPIEPRLNSVELPRTINQLRQAAQAVRNHTWELATIDSQANIRSLYGSLAAPVAIFGPNNFPFAYNAIAGSDFASAIAAGNAVIAKGHPSHPATTELLAELAHQAVLAAGLPAASVQLLYGLPDELGLALVSHPFIGAIGFTGSRRAGLALKAAADQAGKAIYLEMSSINPVVMLAGAVTERAEALAAEFAGSCTLGAGQFCTNPGLLILEHSAASADFIAATKAHFSQHPSLTLLNHGVLAGLEQGIEHLQDAGAQVLVGGHVLDDGYRYANSLLYVAGNSFLANPQALSHEVFGPVSLIVECVDQAEVLRVLDCLEGNLTGSIYSSSSGADEAFYQIVAERLRSKVGRLLNDKMPTGVAVSSAMNHGGPYPATGHAGWTAVGFPATIRRFAALHCYDNVRESRLPEILQNANPQAIWRLVDGQWSNAGID